jgi:hypothetical protein
MARLADQQCWYLFPTVGLSAANDGLLLEALASVVLESLRRFLPDDVVDRLIEKVRWSDTRTMIEQAYDTRLLMDMGYYFQAEDDCYAVSNPRNNRNDSLVFPFAGKGFLLRLLGRFFADTPRGAVMCRCKN